MRILWIEGEAPAWALRERLERRGAQLRVHALSAAALSSDRRALAELDPVLEGLAREADGVGVGVGVVGSGRAGTLAFLLGCTRRVAAVVDVEGPVLHAQLSAERPTQPLELALNLEGAFLGLFARGGPVGSEERGLLAARLAVAARPHELLLHDGGAGLFDPGAGGYDAGRADELGERVCAFLVEHLTESDPGTR